MALDWYGDPDLGNGHPDRGIPSLSEQQFKWLLPSNYASQNPDIYLDPEYTAAWNVGVTITVTADEDNGLDGHGERDGARSETPSSTCPANGWGTPPGAWTTRRTRASPPGSRSPSRTTTKRAQVRALNYAGTRLRLDARIS